MKLARKLTLAFVVVMTAVLVASAVWSASSEVQQSRQDVERDHRTLGSGLRPAVVLAWRDEGEARALQLVEETNLQTRSDLLIRWVWLDADAPSRYRAAVPPVALDAVRAGRVEHHRIERRDGPWLYTFVPVRVPSGRTGAIEMGESLANESAALRAAMIRTAIVTASIALLGAIATSLLGLFLVGRPVAELVAQARRVGAGDLRRRLDVRQQDEIGSLAAETNAMVDRLQAVESARAAALEQLQHADRLNTVGKLASGIAHELGTPLNVITLEAKRIALGRATGPAAQESAELISAQGERMTKIIQQLLEFSRRRPPRLAPLDVGDAVAHSVALVQPLADRRRVRLAVAAAGPVAVVADPGRIEQVLTNVIVNGIQASPEGGELCVEVSRIERARPGDGPAASVRSWARIDVVDRGSGIAPEVLPHVFEPFFTTKEVGEGTGLGLSVAYGIVEEHGGFIDVESEVGRGARFGIHLPASEPSA